MLVTVLYHWLSLAIQTVNILHVDLSDMYGMLCYKVMEAGCMITGGGALICILLLSLK